MAVRSTIIKPEHNSILIANTIIDHSLLFFQAHDTQGKLEVL